MVYTVDWPTHSALCTGVLLLRHPLLPALSAAADHNMVNAVIEYSNLLKQLVNFPALQSHCRKQLECSVAAAAAAAAAVLESDSVVLPDSGSL
jgi:hypothetical protein